MSITARFPAAVDTIVAGGGTAGAAVARLAEGSAEHTLLLEAGPDYGPASSGRWPRDLLDATSVASSHDWGYTGEFAGRVIRFGRARVIGGCSSHNAGAVVFGSRLDYDGWAGAGNAGWSARDLQPLFAAAWTTLRVRHVSPGELTPFQRACMDAIAASGIPAVQDLNDLDENAGVAPFPVNIDRMVRVNSAFAYLDPVRDRLLVAGDAPVERVLVRGGRAVGVAVRDGERLTEIGAARVVLSAGTYGSPAILLRSGIGPAGELAALGVKPVLDLPGVGRNLHDQPCVELRYEGSSELTGQMERHRAETGWLPHEQVIAKFPSASCRRGFDMHIYPVGGYSKNLSAWSWFLGAACLTPLSRGTVRLTGPGSEDKLRIDHGYLTDPGRSRPRDARRGRRARTRNSGDSGTIQAPRPGNAPRPGRHGQAGDRTFHRSRRRALLPPGRELQDGAGQRSRRGRRRRRPRTRDRRPVRGRRVTHAERHLRQHEHADGGHRRENRPVTATQHCR